MLEPSLDRDELGLNSDSKIPADFIPASCLVDLAGNIVEATGSFATFVAKPATEILGHPFSHFISSEDQKSFSAQISRISKQEQPSALSLNLIRNNGQILGTQVFLIPISQVSRSPKIRLILVEQPGRESQKATIALQESEERYRGLVELSPDVIAVSFEGKIDYINPAGVQIFRAESEADILGRPLLDFFHPSSHKHVLERMEQLKQEQTISPIDLLFLRKDGSTMEAESRAITLPWKGKKAALAIVRDNTERKKAEGTIKESEARYRTLATVSPVGIFRTDSQGKFSFINDHLSQILGKPSSALLHQSLLESVHPHDQEWVSNSWHSAQTKSLSFKSEFRLKRPDDTLIWVIGNAEPDITDKGTIAGFIGTLVNITERKQAEILLAFQNLALNQIAERRPLQITLTALVQFLENECEGCQGGILKFLPGNVQPVWISGERLPQEIKEESLINGMQGFISRPIVGANGQLLGSIVLRFPEKTEPSAFHLKLMEMAATMAALGMDRARQESISQKNLELAEENHRILAANRMKTEFMATMSHELRTPLNAIIGFSQLLIDHKAGPLTEKQSEYMGDILEGGMHLLRLITDVLDLSKIEAGKMQLNLEVIHVENSIREVCEILMPMALSKKIRIRISVDSSLEEAKLDSQKFRQILFNLVSNAIKFSRPEGEVSLSVKPEEPTGFRLTVADHGIGISETDIPKLFQQFQQLTSGANREFSGSGLGLVITQKLVELHKGKVWVESKSNQGSRFYAVFPNSRVELVDS